MARESLMNMAQTLGGYNDTVSPIEAIVIIGDLTLARAGNGRVMIPFPLDHGVWSKRADDVVAHLLTTYRLDSGYSGGYDLWVTGTVSPLAHEGFAGHGVSVTENVDERLVMMD